MTKDFVVNLKTTKAEQKWSLPPRALPKVENEGPVPPKDSPSLTPIHHPLHEGRNANLVLHLPPGFQPLQQQSNARPANTASDKTRDKHCQSPGHLLIGRDHLVQQEHQHDGQEGVLHGEMRCGGLSENCPVMTLIGGSCCCAAKKHGGKK